MTVQSLDFGTVTSVIAEIDNTSDEEIFGFDGLLITPDRRSYEVVESQASGVSRIWFGG